MSSLIRKIPGPVLMGFNEVFDESYGDASTPKPYVQVTPSKIGTTLLPFLCPKCSTILTVRGLRNYYDKERKFCWCPNCRVRFTVNQKGTALPLGIPAGAFVAPSLVNGEVMKVEDVSDGALMLIGAEICR